MKSAAPVMLSPEERSKVDTWARGKSFPLRLVQRALIVQMAADGVQNQDIAQELGVSRPTVQL
jgi:DNA-binding NarL/FixJ family response regulator